MRVNPKIQGQPTIGRCAGQLQGLSSAAQVESALIPSDLYNNTFQLQEIRFEEVRDGNKPSAGSVLPPPCPSSFTRQLSFSIAERLYSTAAVR
jgi:hypothetical protein